MSEPMPVTEFARRYLEDVLSFFGLNVRVEDKLTEGATVELNIPSTRLNGFLIGQRGRNLQSLQHLTNMAVHNSGYPEARVMLDVAGYKRQQQERLTKRLRPIVEGVAASGATHEFEPMTAAERRVVHQLVGDTEGVESHSEGEGHQRRVIVKSTKAPPDPPPADKPEASAEPSDATNNA